MKLQPKQQITQSINLERKTQIDEGIALAKKIDLLRETLASLEKQHNDFIAGSRVEIEKNLKVLQERKSNLLGEINKLEERRVILMKPLDDEWLKIEDEKQELERVRIIQSSSQQQLNENWEVFKKDVDSLNKRERLIESKEQQIETVTHETLELNKKAKELKETKAREYDEFKKEVADKTKDLNTREKELVTQANLNEHNKNILDKREKQLNDKERAIKDKYETLQRTINRLKK